MAYKHTRIEDIIKMLEAKSGFITETAKALGISYQSLHRRIRTNEKLKEAYDAINERKLDYTESKLFDLIRDGNLGAICFHLKCKGKHRGWEERQIIRAEGTGGIVSVKLDLSEKTSDELVAIHDTLQMLREMAVADGKSDK